MRAAKISQLMQMQLKRNSRVGFGLQVRRLLTVSRRSPLFRPSQ